MPGRDRGAVRPQPPFLDQKHLVAIDGNRLAFEDDQRLAARGLRLAVAEQAGIAQKGAGMAQGEPEGFAGAGSKRRPRQQRLSGIGAVDAPPVQRQRDLQPVTEA